MRIIRQIFLTFLCVSLFTNLAFAQKGGKGSVLAKYVKEHYESAQACKPLSEEELTEIQTTINDYLYDRYNVGKNQGYTVKEKTEDKNIFSNNPYAKYEINKKYDEYKNVLYQDVWKNTPYANLQPNELNENVNTLFDEISTLLKENPFYQSNKYASYCDKAGLILADLAVFIGIGNIAQAALPAATTVTEFSAISGFAWDFSSLFRAPAVIQGTTVLQGTNTLGRIGSLSIGFGSSMIIMDKLNSQIQNAWHILDEDQTVLGAQKNILRALKTDFKLHEQINDVRNNAELTDVQKARRIDTRYKETIIKIYALNYIKTYLKYSEKPEKYFWALLDLTSLLQSQSTVTFGYETGEKFEISPLPRLIERTPSMKYTLEKLMTIHKGGYGIKSLGKRYENTVKERASKNVEELMLQELDKNLISN